MNCRNSNRESAVTRSVLVAFALCFANLPLLADEAVTISGELKQWHRVTLTFDGPESGEDADPNPFRDYRLNVFFTNGNRCYIVPGFYAADGDAAETGAKRAANGESILHPTKPASGHTSPLFAQGPKSQSTPVPAQAQPLVPTGWPEHSPLHLPTKSPLTSARKGFCSTQANITSALRARESTS